MTYLNINGKLLSATAAGLQVDNRAFRYGYGLFETMLWKEGEISLWQYHHERLWKGMNALGFIIPKLATEGSLKNEIIRTVEKNKLGKICRVRLQVFAGSGGMLADAPGMEYVIECFALDEQATMLNEHGLTLGIANGVQKSADILANHKTTNALVYAIAAQQARAEKWNDALVRNTHGHIIESTIANICWIKDGQAYTPPLSDGCIAGVMRRVLLEKWPGGITEKSLDEETLAQADEAFLTNAVRGIKWVGRIADKEYGNTLIQKIYGQLF